ncbi:THAP domain-containing protein 2-like [Mugil cephalus]|uniref:THAP domain-containing protein 2-like n=1 Tax=Mugil cephalus TaxID=48193 RepID=UPI001FB7F2B9|nr:THAP domain-containing protein 2-like [Mugil cephalus]
MPEHCAAFSCKNRRTVQNKTRGITFHKFPKDVELRRKWDIAVRRHRFTSSKSSVLCSEHFKAEDFDRTGQIVRLKDGVIPSVFSFSAHLQRPQKARTTSTSKKAKESLSVPSLHDSETSASLPHPEIDHSYALPGCLNSLKAIINRSMERVESLERERKNTKAREKRARISMKCLLEDLREKNLLSEELKERLDFYSGASLLLGSSSTLTL